MKTKKIEYKGLKNLASTINHSNHINVNFNENNDKMNEARHFLINNNFVKTADCYWSEIWEWGKKTVIINR